MPSDVNPNSSDAWFAKLAADIKHQDKTFDMRMTRQDAVLASINAHVEKTNGRVNKLEEAKWRLVGWCAAIVAVFTVLGWAVESGVRVTFK